MAGEWPEVTIEEIAEHVAMGPFGSSIKVETFVENGIPIISGQHLQGQRLNDQVGYNFVSEEHASRLARANVQRGDVIFTHAGNIGQVAYIPGDSKFERYIISQRQFYLRPNRKVARPEFIVAFFKTPEGRHKLLANASQVGVPSIARPVSYLRTIELSLPPLSEQRAIAHVLGTLDDKIELNRRMSATLEAMARALFKAWFVDFEPVRAKAEGRDPGLPPHLADLFPDRLVETEHGEVPERWNVGAVSDLAEVASGKRPGERYSDPSPGACVPLWGGNGPMAFVPKPLINEPILLTGRVGTLGSVFRITSPCWPSDNTLFIRPNQTSAFEYLFLQMCQIDLKSLNRGSTQPLLTQRDLKSQRLLLPSPRVLGQFSRVAASMYRRIDEIERESGTLAALRDTLLPQLISGDLRVKDAETFLDRVL